MNRSAPSVWAISPEERNKHDQKFDTLSPLHGYVSGDQARKFFLQSGLPASVLAEIWALADMNKDGKMDRLEFSIAMKLVKLKLQGTNLPSALPIIMKQPPVAVPTLSNSTYGISMSTMPMMSGANYTMLTPITMATPGLAPSMAMTGLSHLGPTATGLSPLMASAPVRPMMPSVGNATLPNGTMAIPQYLLSSPSFMTPMSAVPSDWAVPHASRLKYRQQFNSLDKQMIGFLTGTQVRSAMATTMLTQTQLASIWTLADVDKDGKLKAEEFILAMHLVDMARCGQPLPITLPTELVPPSQRYVDTLKICSTSFYLFTYLVTFEDKFKANLDKGNAELEKRRLALQEAERREQERRAQKEREEREKREREAREAEEQRRKEEEKRQERLRELERQREEERQKELERKEAAQRELERQRKEELERKRRGELQIKKVQEQDEIVKLKAKKKSLEMELEAVGNKHRQISDRLRDIQNKRKLQKTQLDLNWQRKETQQQDIYNLQKQLEEFQRKLHQLTPEQKRLSEKLKTMSVGNIPASTLSTLMVGVTEKRANCFKLQQQRDALEQDTAAKLAEMDQYNSEIQMENERLRQEKLRREEEERQRKLQEEREAKRREAEERERQALIQAAKEQVERDLRAKEEAERMKREEEERKKREEEERRRKAERQRHEEERRRLEEERRQLEEERRKLEEERKQEERRRKEEEERRRKEEERKEEERRRVREEEERKRQKAAEAAVRDAEERRRQEEEDRRRHEEEDRRKRDEERRRLQQQQEEERKRREEEKRKVEEERKRKEEEEQRRKGEEERKRKEEPPRQQPSSTGGRLDIQAMLKGLEERKGGQLRNRQRRKSAALSSFKALYAFTARNNEELSFNEEDIVEVDETVERDEGWLYGSRLGKMGWFPESYVERVTPSGAATTTAAPSPAKLPLQSQLSNALESLPADADSSDGTQLEEYVALYTYESPELSDLTFNEGDVILVSKREGEWWHGSRGDRTGLFPSNYVKPKETDTSSTSGKKKPEIGQVIKPHSPTGPDQLILENGQLVLILGKNSSGWWLGELQARGKKRQKGWFPASNIKILGSNSGKSTPASQVIAIYDYSAANQDEISFSKGQLINVLDKSNPDWWKGEINGATGLFPFNYVKLTTADCDPSQQWCADLNSLDSLSSQEKKRQGYIHELIQTEERYVEDLQIVLEVFYKPMSESGRLNEAEMSLIFVNWKELLACNTKLVQALHDRKKTGGEKMPVQMIGDILASELSHMQPYIRFCSCQINGATLLQTRTDNEPDFKNFLKKIATDYRCKGMPLSSFLLKPMQRITRYPLHIKSILESTAEGHADRGPLKQALERAEELCQQVNEGVREKENSDRLEWIQNHVQCEGIIEKLTFNSLTNCLGPRKLLHSGKMYKVKSNKELWAFLFNDFLLLTHAAKQFTSSGLDKLFSNKNNVQLKTYKPPVLLNEVLVKLPDPSSDEPIFHISHIDRVYVLKTDNIKERTSWVHKIKAASEEFIETEKKKRDKAYQARAVKTSGIGRLLVTILEATELKAGKPNGKSNPYCEVTMGPQIFTSRTINDTLNPKWNFNCQFHIKDLYQDVLSIAIFERDQFSPDDFLGRTEIPVATIKKELENKGSVTRRLLLHEVPTGEVWVRLDLQLFGSK
uniref:Intersectin-2-like n=1 Tax=Gouania willdenowi TaxID=441366 RepID=A0A8C5GVI1_GOUWI